MEPRAVLKRLRWRADFVYGDGRPSCCGNGENWPDRQGRPWSNGRASGSGGGNLVPCHFRFAPVSDLVSFLVHAMRRRVNAPRCTKIQVAKGTWADGKQCGTEVRAMFLGYWGRCWPWLGIARIFHVSWDAVRRAVGVPVAWHGAGAGQEGVGVVGVYETARRSGYRNRSEGHWHVGQGGRLWEGWRAVARGGRAAGSGLGLGERRACGGAVRARQKACGNVVSRRSRRALRGAGAGAAPRAGQLGEMATRLRAAEARKRPGREPGLRLARGRWLRRPEKLTEKRQLKLSALRELNLWTVRTDRLKENFQPFWNSARPVDSLLPCQRGLTMLCAVRPPDAKRGAGPERAAVVLAEGVPLRLGACVGQAGGGTARRNRSSEERTGSSRAGLGAVNLEHHLGDLPEPALTFC